MFFLKICQVGGDLRGDPGPPSTDALRLAADDGLLADRPKGIDGTSAA